MPLTILELKAAASFLRHARELIDRVKDSWKGQDGIVAARLFAISERISHEIDFTDKLIIKQTPPSS